MKTTITLLFNIYFLVLTAQSSIAIANFEKCNNSKWKGTLTYKNYSDGKEVTLETVMELRIKNNGLIYTVEYPNEPSANTTFRKKINKNGTCFGNEKVLENKILENGMRKIVTYVVGKDNNKRATMYFTYVFDEKEMSVIKEVKYNNSKEKFIRNKQVYQRI